MASPEEKTTPRIRGNTKLTQFAARQMRVSMTEAERTLWSALRRKQLNELKFRAQHPVGPFILDFYCPQVKLAVEVDGAIHVAQAQVDEAPTQLLAAYGYSVIRFTNDQVLTDLPSVLATIQAEVRKLLEKQS